MSIEKILTAKGVKYKVTIDIPSIDGAKRKRVTKRFEKKSKATEWEREQRVLIDGGGFIVSKKMSFAAYATDWIRNHAPHITKGTHKEYAAKIERKFIPHFGHKNIKDITKQDCKQFIPYLTGLGLQAKTINTYLIIARQIFSEAVKDELIIKSPFLEIKKIKEPETDFSFWETEEIEYFISKSKDWPLFDFTMVALCTGMRIGEVVVLRPKDVNFDTNFIRVSRAADKTVDGVTHTKGKNIRNVPMSKRVQTILKKRTRVLDKEDYIFTHKGKRVDKNHFATNHWRPHQIRIKVKNSIRFHDLRHTYASHFMINNGNVFTLQKILGHQDIKDTMKYAHLSPTHLQDAIGIVSF